MGAILNSDSTDAYVKFVGKCFRELYPGRAKGVLKSTDLKRIPEQCKGTSIRQDRGHRDTTIYIENEREYQS